MPIGNNPKRKVNNKDMEMTVLGQHSLEPISGGVGVYSANYTQTQISFIQFAELS